MIVRVLIAWVLVSFLTTPIWWPKIRVRLTWVDK